MSFGLSSAHWATRLAVWCWWCAANVVVRTTEGWVLPTTTTTLTNTASCGGGRRTTKSRRCFPQFFPSSSSSVSSSPFSSSSLTRLSAALPEGYQEFGEHLIRKAGSECGITKDEDLTIEWKAGRIVVTVRGKVYVSTTRQDDDDDDEDAILDMEDEDDEDAGIEAGDENDGDDSDDEGDEDEDSAADATNDTAHPSGVDVTALARVINKAFDDDGVGFAIAETHEIEVTTPGASEELQGAVMFEAYKGFDVICQQQDTKTKKIKQVEGKLVERNEEFTVLNIKGRMKKMKNSTVLSVKLPKAKREKGK